MNSQSNRGFNARDSTIPHKKNAHNPTGPFRLGGTTSEECSSTEHLCYQTGQTHPDSTPLCRYIHPHLIIHIHIHILTLYNMNVYLYDNMWGPRVILYNLYTHSKACYNTDIHSETAGSS